MWDFRRPLGILVRTRQCGLVGAWCSSWANHWRTEDSFLPCKGLSRAQNAATAVAHLGYESKRRPRAVEGIHCEILLSPVTPAGVPTPLPRICSLQPTHCGFPRGYGFFSMARSSPIETVQRCHSILVRWPGFSAHSADFRQGPARANPEGGGSGGRESCFICVILFCNIRFALFVQEKTIASCL